MFEVKADSGGGIGYGRAELDYNFGPEHPMQPGRINALIDLLETCGLWRSTGEDSRLPLRAATVEDLSLAHTSDYIAAVQTLSTPGSSKAESDEGQLLAITYGFAD